MHKNAIGFVVNMPNSEIVDLGTVFGMSVSSSYRPEDFSVQNGYGLLSWGLFESAAAWQISPNPTEAEGQLGRLRVRTKDAAVIETTDLRDDRWHHIAIVMYGGEEADLSTHVLLYIDGQLDRRSRQH